MSLLSEVNHISDVIYNLNDVLSIST